ncbi:hypothetical protein KM176_05525 [Pseudooceanicola sp. CBS1P-1]|uniref:Uncharacterized protein n=1 Tax=Pseudooceanicola albus TaxID=2692189 RepID=A0A6L7FX72_9RHOB|nr:MULTISPECIES: hypothetical protein [Pseudooceanicola]MBT9383312.1 hypothetical protein [Pseudooceanicola endophyticus]MXN16365.1 hypothetical protein [Pseudooceanicola albus]
MDSAEQAEGARRVRALLVEPLQRRGLVKPSAMTKDQFAAMLDDMCARLAYMSAGSIAALEEEAAGMASGKDRDRFPIAQRILEKASDIEPPGDDASPLIRAVFANQVGHEALAGGWAPELLAEVRRTRKWPGKYTLSQVRAQADDALRKMTRLREFEGQGQALTQEESTWLQRRRDALAKCRRIADLGQMAEGGA